VRLSYTNLIPHGKLLAFSLDTLPLRKQWKILRKEGNREREELIRGEKLAIGFRLVLSRMAGEAQPIILQR
jgi:hypothetical protein